MVKFWMGRSAAVAAALFFSAFSNSAFANFHLWEIKEVFTNAAGTVQFIEFFTTEPGEAFLMNHNIVITSDGMSKTITFDHHLANPTTNMHFLLATAGFGSLAGGVTPDYTPVSGNLFDPNAANIMFDFAHGNDTLSLTGAQIPKDGRNSLTDSNVDPFSTVDNLAVTVNSPTNFAGAAGSVNLGGGTPIPGDFTGNNVVDGVDLMVWRNNFGATGAPTVSQGNADADGDVDGRDFLVWQRNVGATSSAAAAAASIPEPTGAALATLAALALAARRRQQRRS